MNCEYDENGFCRRYSTLDIDFPCKGDGECPGYAEAGEMTPEEALGRYDRIRYNLLNHDDKVATDIAFDALREKVARSQKCPYCDVAKANEGVRNTALWVKEAQTNKWTMMGKKLLFCPMCGRRLEEVKEQ